MSVSLNGSVSYLGHCEPISLTWVGLPRDEVEPIVAVDDEDEGEELEEDGEFADEKELVEEDEEEDDFDEDDFDDDFDDDFEEDVDESSEANYDDSKEPGDDGDGADEELDEEFEDDL
jgi:hypothetical protein